MPNPWPDISDRLFLQTALRASEQGKRIWKVVVFYIPCLAQGRLILREIMEMLKEMKELEKKLVKLIEDERSLLRHEMKV